jgi:hypothetical protein
MHLVLKLNFLSLLKDPTNKINTKLYNYFLVLSKACNKKTTYLKKININQYLSMPKTVTHVNLKNHFPLHDFYLSDKISVQIFRYTINDDTISLLHHCNMSHRYNEPMVKLMKVKNVKKINYLDDSSYLNQLFHNKILLYADKYYSLTVKKMNVDGKSKSDMYILPTDHKLKVYDRYAQKYVIRKRSVIEDYSNKTDRDLSEDPFNNNIVTNPVDGYIKTFPINKTLQFNIYGMTHTYQSLKLKDYLNGSGMIIEISSHKDDSKLLYRPYKTAISDIRLEKNNYHLLAETEYYLPPNLLGRDYFSVVYGDHSNEGHGYFKDDSYLPKYPEVRLKYKMIVISRNKDSVTINSLKHNKNNQEIGHVDKDMTLIIVFNRKIKFLPDIKNNPNTPVYIDGNDKIGELL